MSILFEDNSWISGDWVSVAATAYFELTKQVIDAFFQPDKIQSIEARENEYETIDVFCKENDKEIEIDFDFLQLSGKINGKKQLEILEEIFYSDSSIDCSAIIMLFHQMIDGYISNWKHVSSAFK